MINSYDKLMLIIALRKYWKKTLSQLDDASSNVSIIFAYVGLHFECISCYKSVVVTGASLLDKNSLSSLMFFKIASSS